MQEIFEFLNQGWVGTVVGLLSLTVALVVFWLSRVGAILATQYDEVQLIGGRSSAFSEEVKVYFRDHEVPRLTLTRIWFWNAGKRGVRGEDIVDSDPLRINFPGGVLKTTVLQQARNVSGLTVVPKEGTRPEVIVSFDFLDPGDGAVVEVLHSGAKGGVQVDGTVRGLPAGVQDWGQAWQDEQKSPTRRIQRLAKIMAVTGIATATGAFFLPHIDSTLSKMNSGLDFAGLVQVSMFLAGILYTLLPAVLIWVRRRRFPRALLFDPQENAGREVSRKAGAVEIPENRTTQRIETDG